MAKQVGGDYYEKLAIQPWDYVAANGLGFFEGNVVKYVTRWKSKGGVSDLRKAITNLEKLIEVETAEEVKHEPATAGVMRCDECGGGGYLYYRADRKLVCDKCIGLKSAEAFTCVRCDAKCNHSDRLCDECFKLMTANVWLH